MIIVTRPRHEDILPRPPKGIPGRSNVQHRILNRKRQGNRTCRLNPPRKNLAEGCVELQCSVLDIRFSFDVGRSMFDVRCSSLNLSLRSLRLERVKRVGVSYCPPQKINRLTAQIEILEYSSFIRRSMLDVRCSVWVATNYKLRTTNHKPRTQYLSLYASNEPSKWAVNIHPILRTIWKISYHKTKA